MTQTIVKEKAPRNRTITLDESEQDKLESRLIRLSRKATLDDILGKTINQDCFEAFRYLPNNFVDLAVIDPPYNLSKTFNNGSFKEMSDSKYEEWLDSWVSEMVPLLKPNASIYICGDWRSSSAIYRVASKYFKIQNRITFERDKGRGAKSNWKNCSEDIWFCTMSKEYYFDVDAVKMKKKVIAPYRDQHGQAKDWQDNSDGKYRLTHPSNLWTDVTIPFWSMPENTEHPTQKPEKLIAKIILASSKPGDVIFDPFLGSGTTSVTAKKLDRRFVGIELDKHFCCLAEQRLANADTDRTIQGYSRGVFWERNSGNQVLKEGKAENKSENNTLFGS